MSQHALVGLERPTEAEVNDQKVRRHLAAMAFAAQEGADHEVVRLARAEMCRLVSAICTALSPHRINPAGSCVLCCSPSCSMRAEIRRALLPVRL